MIVDKYFTVFNHYVNINNIKEETFASYAYVKVSFS